VIEHDIIEQRAEVDVSTLAERLRDDAGAIEPIVMWPIVIDAYAFKDASSG